MIYKQMVFNSGTSKMNFNRWLALIAVIVLLLFVWYAVEILLLAFAGILLAVFLRSFADFISRYTKISEGWSLTLVVIFLLASIGLSVWFLAPNVAAQVDNLTESLPRAVERLQERIKEYGWGRQILGQLPEANEVIPDGKQTLSTATSVFSSTLDLLVRFVIVIFVGLYLAADPKIYLTGVKHLIPLEKRDRVVEVIEEIGSVLRWWLIGKILSMIVIGVLVWLGLWLLDIPLALTLGLIAGLLEFIPNIGPLLAFTPAALLALLDSPTKVLYVVIFFSGIQMLESYLLTPLVQQKTVSLPPALTIMAQVLMGLMVGGLGLVLATPLAAVLVVLVKRLYVEDTLGDNTLSVKNED